MQNLKFTAFVAFCLLMLGCQNGVVVSKFKPTAGGWGRTDTLVFNFKAPDTLGTYNLFFNTRLNQDYEFDNLYLISTILFPNGKQIVDTLEYEMAYPNGELMGSGFGSVKENKLWYKEGVRFTEAGDYKIKVTQAMRKFGVVNPLDTLKGVMDFGIQLEANNPSKP